TGSASRGWSTSCSRETGHDGLTGALEAFAMRIVKLSAFVSLDGIMQAPGGPTEDPTSGFRFGGWVAPYGDETIGELVGETFEQDYDLPLGRKSYEIFAAYWPQMDNPIGLR